MTWRLCALTCPLSSLAASHFIEDLVHIYGVRGHTCLIPAHNEMTWNQSRVTRGYASVNSRQSILISPQIAMNPSQF